MYPNIVSDDHYRKITRKLIFFKLVFKFKYTHTHLVISPVPLPELCDEPFSDELSSLREFCVDDGNESSIDMGEDRGGRLCLNDGAGKEATPTNNVLLEQLTDDVTNVGHIHLCIDGSHVWS